MADKTEGCEPAKVPEVEPDIEEKEKVDTMKAFIAMADSIKSTESLEELHEFLEEKLYKDEPTTFKHGVCASVAYTTWSAAPSGRRSGKGHQSMMLNACDPRVQATYLAQKVGTPSYMYGYGQSLANIQQQYNAEIGNTLAQPVLTLVGTNGDGCIVKKLTLWQKIKDWIKQELRIFKKMIMDYYGQT